MITPHGAERLQAAHERYVTALRTFNNLRMAKRHRAGQPDYIDQWSKAHRRVKEAFAE